MIQPEFRELYKIIPIYKGKVEMSDLGNYRGIFILNILRMIKVKLIIKDKEDIVELIPKSVREKKVAEIILFVLSSCMN